MHPTAPWKLVADRTQRSSYSMPEFGLMREKNSERVAALDLKQPVTELVMVHDPGFSTPRITMHMCLRVC